MPFYGWIIVGVWAGLSLLTPFGVLAWQFRYFFLQGRIRAEFISDRSTVTRVIKLGKSAEHFVINMFGERRAFKIDVDRMRASGRERLPKAWYFIGEAHLAGEIETKDGEGGLVTLDLYEPLDMDNVTVSYATSGKEYVAAATNNVMKNVFDAFKRKVIDSTMALIITIGVMLLGFGGLALFIENKFKELGN